MVKWYDVCGLYDVIFIEQLGKQFGVYLLVLEDILDIQ